MMELKEKEREDILARVGRRRQANEAWNYVY